MFPSSPLVSTLSKNNWSGIPSLYVYMESARLRRALHLFATPTPVSAYRNTPALYPHLGAFHLSVAATCSRYSGRTFQLARSCALGPHKRLEIPRADSEVLGQANRGATSSSIVRVCSLGLRPRYGKENQEVRAHIYAPLFADLIPQSRKIRRDSKKLESGRTGMGETRKEKWLSPRNRYDEKEGGNDGLKHFYTFFPFSSFLPSFLPSFSPGCRADQLLKRHCFANRERKTTSGLPWILRPAAVLFALPRRSLSLGCSSADPAVSPPERLFSSGWTGEIIRLILNGALWAFRGIDRPQSGNHTESETRSRDFPWVPSPTNNPAAATWMPVHLCGSCRGYFDIMKRPDRANIFNKLLKLSMIGRSPAVEQDREENTIMGTNY
ncbi:hypothetical protein DBV15_11027 [Temnothorax longispinosus]|uniref:Uncharacterized protein n=1 Tax=Temnothorax longispinosus TaxID=300112 RepID=A0A4V3SAZ5_9HYME|nr:hypothetical protein DBV15_11027 [Temnothorax longispinosus]